MEPSKEFYQSMQQLVEFLKKMLSQNPSALPRELFSVSDKEQQVNLNFCFFNLFPVTEEELEELEAIYDQLMPASEDAASSELRPELSASDVEFLKKNGIRF